MNYIPEKIRLQVWQRASNCYEYCLLANETAFFRHEIDHIISLKHKGKDVLENYALSCYYCNRNKRTDVGSIHDNKFTRFFNPRKDKWLMHFDLNLNTAVIHSKTGIGEVTSHILGFNQIDRIIERQILIAAQKYPPFILK
jgi:HNH endonuclease